MAKAVKREWSDWLNPVLVKEIRQYFHNFGILAVMGVLLVVQLMMLVVMQYQVSESRSAFSDSGAVMFGLVAGSMGLAAFLVCAFGAMLRFTGERRDRELDFSYITVITPNRIIWGKLLGSLVMIIFIYALCLPFMVIAYFLRGIAMGDMFLVALAMLPPLLVATQAGILVGSAGKRWLIGVFCLAMFFFGQPAALFFAAFLWGLFRGTDSVGAIIFLWCVFCAILLGLLYALSVAAVSSRFSNRMLPVRLFLVGTFVCSPLIGLGVALAGGMTADIGKVMLVSLTAVGSTVAALCATLAAFERLDPGERVRRQRPRNPVGRVCHGLVSSGAWSGILLAHLLLAVAALAVFFAYRLDSATWFDAFFWVSGCSYFLFYANIAIWAAGNWKVLPGWCYWAFTVIAFVVLPLLLSGIVTLAGRHDVDVMLLTTPFCLINSSGGGWMLLFGPALAAGALLLAGFARLSRPAEGGRRS